MQRGQGDFARNAVGVAPPRSFILDASVLEEAEYHKIVREDVKNSSIQFEFPDGLNKIDLFEECRALTMLEDFDTMFDLTMQYLVGKPVSIKIKNSHDVWVELCAFQVVDRFQNLRGIDAIDQYPVVITWLTEFIGASLLKKYPIPGQDQSQPQESEKEKKRLRKKTRSILEIPRGPETPVL